MQSETLERGCELMTGQKQTTRITYRIIAQTEQKAIMEYTYICPNCMRKTTVSSEAYPSDYGRLETGGFCEELTCSKCNQSADVRFWAAMKTE